MLTIYQIYCKNPDITDCYIGSTKDYLRRKSDHKTNCRNKNRKQHNYKLYKFIRENGGFENWNFKILNQVKYHEELRFFQEQAYINLIKPSLNSCDAVFDVEKNKEKNKEYHMNYRIEKKEKIKKKSKEYYQKNRDEMIRKRSIYREKNREKINEQKLKYHYENREKNNAKRRERCLKKKLSQAEELV